MNVKTPFIFKVIGLIVLALLAVTVLIGCWITRTENACWSREAAEAFEKYGSLKTRSEIERSIDAEQASGSNPIEVLEKDPNGCSFGSKGQTILRFYFDKEDRLTTIQVFRDYFAADYEMQLVEERRY